MFFGRWGGLAVPDRHARLLVPTCQEGDIRRTR